MDILGYIALFFVGLVLGTFGGGGSILAVPILVYLFSMDAVMASAYSLFIVGSTSLVGSILKYDTQMVSLRVGFIFGMPSLLAIFIARKWIIPAIPEILFQFDGVPFTKRAFLLGGFALLMIAASLALVVKKNPPPHSRKSHPVFYLILWGTLTGLVTGLVGVGGGFLIIPALVYLTDLPFKTAVGTTLLIIATNSLIGFTGDVLNHPVHWQFLLQITSLSVLGIFIGNRSSQIVSAEKLRRLFGWFILCMGSAILIKEVIFPIHG